MLLKKEQSSDVCEYAPIARVLHSMDPASQLTVKRKFDVAFVIAKEHLPFTKMKPLCELEERMTLTSDDLWTTKIISLITVHTVIRNYLT